MGSNFEEVSSFMKSPFYHAVLLKVKIQDGLFQISHTTVNEFCTPTACACRKVIPLNERCIKPWRLKNRQYIIAGGLVLDWPQVQVPLTAFLGSPGFSPLLTGKDLLIQATLCLLSNTAPRRK